MPSKQYLAKIEARRQHNAEAQRRRLYAALRYNNVPPSTLTHSVQFMDRMITVTELEYLWLKVRGHIMENYHGTPIVTNHNHLYFKEGE